MATQDGQQFVESTNSRLQIIEAAIANHVMPDDGRTDRQIQSSLLWMENEITIMTQLVTDMNQRLNENAFNQMIDAKIATSFELVKTMINLRRAIRR